MPRFRLIARFKDLSGDGDDFDHPLLRMKYSTAKEAFAELHAVLRTVSMPKPDPDDDVRIILLNEDFSDTGLFYDIPK